MVGGHTTYPIIQRGTLCQEKNSFAAVDRTESLGASRTRIVRHLLAESLLLAVLGAIAGLLIDIVCAGLISNLSLPLPIPIRLVVTPDWRLLLYGALVAVLSALISGLMPALRAVRKDVNGALRN